MNLERIKEKLEAIVSGEVTFLHNGLCSYLKLSLNYQENKLIKSYSETWGHYSGSYTYPIPADYSFNPVQEPVEIYGVYQRRGLNFIDPETEYGRLRLDLVRYWLECINKELEKRK